ncbi:MAG: alpha-glucosidase [Thermosphaera sp.]|mgnify:CR=1 FL=1
MDSTSYLREVSENLDRLVKNKKLRNLEKLEKDFSQAKEAVEYSIRYMVRDNVEYAKSLRQKSFEILSKVESFSQDFVPKSLLEDLKLFLKYCRMSVYEFTDRIKDVRRAYRSYLWGMIIFLLLGGTYRMEFAVSAIILAFPIILAMGGLRRRRATGLMLAYATMPLPMVIFVMMLTYALYAFNNPEEISFIASAYGTSIETAYLLIILVSLGSFIGLFLLSYALKKLVENRYAFF